MEQLIYEIAGIRYLLFSLPITEGKEYAEIEEKVKKYNGIMQGVKDITPAFFGGHAILNVLIPENKAIEFSNED